MEEEKFPHTREPLHWPGWGVGWGEASEPQRRAQRQRCRGQSKEIPTLRFGADCTHQHETLVCSPAKASGVWELRFGLRRSDPRETLHRELAV